MLLLMRVANLTFCNVWVQDPNSFVDEKSECRLYIGNLDMRISEYGQPVELIPLFSISVNL